MISVALETLSSLKVSIRVTTDGHEGTIRIDALREEFIRPQVVATDKLTDAHEEGSSFLFNVIRHPLTTAWIVLPSVREEIYVTNHFLHSQSASHYRLGVSVINVHVLRIRLIQAHQRIDVLEERFGGVQPRDSSNFQVKVFL